MSFKPTLYLQPGDLIYVTTAVGAAVLVLMILSYALRNISKIPHSEFDLPERMADIFIASIFFLWTLPLLLVLSILIKLTSPGPVFVRGTKCGIRWGLGNKPFRAWKFRTMKIWEEPKPFTYTPIAKDKRLTAIGRVLKKTGLDELPQLINVLVGDMSIFGPKPIFPEEALKIKERFPYRFTVKPGLISVWHLEPHLDLIHRRVIKVIDSEGNFAKEEEYVSRMTLLFNMKLFLRFTVTFLARFFLRLEESKLEKPEETDVVTQQLVWNLLFLTLTLSPILPIIFLLR